MSSLVTTLLTIIILFAFIIHVIQISKRSVAGALRRKSGLLLDDVPCAPYHKSVIIICRRRARPLVGHIVTVTKSAVHVSSRTNIICLGNGPLSRPCIQKKHAPTLRFAKRLAIPRKRIFTVNSGHSNSLSDHCFKTFSLRSIVNGIVCHLAPRLKGVRDRCSVCRKWPRRGNAGIRQSLQHPSERKKRDPFWANVQWKRRRASK